VQENNKGKKKKKRRRAFSLIISCKGVSVFLLQKAKMTKTKARKETREEADPVTLHCSSVHLAASQASFRVFLSNFAVGEFLGTFFCSTGISLQRGQKKSEGAKQTKEKSLQHIWFFLPSLRACVLV
jgi:hypothetical protein